MDNNPTNQEYDDDEHIYGMRKIIYLQKYGVKRFPYRGRRRYKPSLTQSLDGGIVITNDVFGLTIRQFDRIYQICLERRKTHEQSILNLRYPDKSSNKYLEYLQDCVYYKEDILPWPGNVLREKYFYENLVYTIGPEMQIHTRQRLLIVKDIIHNLFENNTMQISSGSLAEGLDLPGSDLDLMLLIKNVNVIQNGRNIKHPIQHTILVMEPDNDHPGFTRLRLIAESEEYTDCLLSDCCESNTNGYYVSVDRFLHNIMHRNSEYQLSLHGPCLSNTNQTFDIATCLQSKKMPHIAIPWVMRRRHQWPPNVVIDKIVNTGCLLVPIGPRTTSDNNLLWRLSFSVAEKQLVHSFNFTQLLCYGLLKLTLKRIINTYDGVKDLLCSYFLKTALFWVSEEVDFEIFKLHNLFHCFFLCLDKLELWINNCYCPNYFIPKHNMFLGKIDQSNNEMLLGILDSIKCGGIDGLMNNVFPAESVNHSLSSTNREKSFIILDFFFYKTCDPDIQSRNLHSYYKSMQYVKSLKMFESSKFITGTCNYYYGMFSQYAAQMLPPPNTKSKGYTIHKLYHRHLQDGIRTDAVSGWLLYASFYYVTGQYNVTLKLTEYVLSRCKHEMVYLSPDIYSEEEINSYRQNVHSKLTFNERIKSATVNSVQYMRHSSLIPEEMQLDVEDDDIEIPPVVLSYCLRFLCHHHLGDICNRQQALDDLLLAVKDDYYFVAIQEVSASKTILGICYETLGDITNAYQCYDEALEDDVKVCRSAKARKSKLLLNLR